MKYRTILLLGAPGAGKGTQGKILGAIPNFYHFACGDVFRHLTPESELGRVFLDYSSRGELVPDEPTIRLWRQHLEAATRDGDFDPAADILVLDGIPRNANQARMLRREPGGAPHSLLQLFRHEQNGPAPAAPRPPGKPSR